MTSLIAIAARAAAEQLAADHGPGVVAEVEAALLVGKPQPPTRYIDPVSLGSLIVSIASLAWTIYSDQRRTTPTPSRDVITRHIRAKLRERGESPGPEVDRVTEIVVTEIIRADRGPQ